MNVISLTLCSLYRQLFGYNAGINDDLSMAGLSLTARLSLPTAPLSMAGLSFAPFSMAPLSMAPLSMAPFSMAPLSLNYGQRPTVFFDTVDNGSESSSTYGNNKDSTQGTTDGPSGAQSGFDATMTGALSAAGVALVVAAVAYKMKRSVAAASSVQSVASDEVSVPSLPSTV